MKNLHILGVFVLTFATACSNPATFQVHPMDDSGSTQVAGTWTIMVYIAADNDLETHALADLNELEAACFGGSGIRVIALVDRHPGYDSSAGDWSESRLYRILDDRRDSPQIISAPQTWNSRDELEFNQELNLGDPRTLEGFLAYGKRRFPADHYGLILWGHGTAWRATDNIEPGYRGGGLDETDGDFLDTLELASALAGAGGCDFLGYDTCFGMNIEQLVECAPHSLFQSGSPGATPSSGWNYTDLGKRWKASGRSPRDMAMASVVSARSTWGIQGPPSLAIESAGLMELLPVFRDWTSALYQASGTSEQRDFLRQGLYGASPEYATQDGELTKDIRGLLAWCTAHGFAFGSTMLLDTLLSQTELKLDPGDPGLTVVLVPLRNGLPYLDFSTYGIGAGMPELAFCSVAGWAPDTVQKNGLLYRLWLETMGAQQ